MTDDIESNYPEDKENHKIFPHNRGENDLITHHRCGILETVTTNINRIWRALKIDSTFYEELKTDPKAPLDAFNLNIVLASIFSLFSVLVEESGVDSVHFFVYSCLSYLVYFYIIVFITWIAGMIIKKVDNTFSQA